jgi:hypothetical protein
VCSTGKRYEGADINETSVRESNEIILFHQLNATVVTRDILSSSGTHECLLTCPPYGAKESWEEPLVIKSCDEWIDECLSRFQCDKYVFIVDQTTKYEDKIVDEIKHSTHFASTSEFVVVL